MGSHWATQQTIFFVLYVRSNTGHPKHDDDGDDDDDNDDDDDDGDDDDNDDVTVIGNFLMPARGEGGILI